MQLWRWPSGTQGNNGQNLAFRVREWYLCTNNTHPPYSHTQFILHGADFWSYFIIIIDVYSPLSLDYPLLRAETWLMLSLKSTWGVRIENSFLLSTHTDWVQRREVAGQSKWQKMHFSYFQEEKSEDLQATESQLQACTGAWEKQGPASLRVLVGKSTGAGDREWLLLGHQQNSGSGARGGFESGHQNLLMHSPWGSPLLV